MIPKGQLFSPIVFSIRIVRASLGYAVSLVRKMAVRCGWKRVFRTATLEILGNLRLYTLGRAGPQ